MKILLLSLLIVGSISFSFATDQISIDTHYHFVVYPPLTSVESELDKLLAFTKKNSIAQTFLISSAFERWDERMTLDSQVQEVTQQYPDRFWGVCGARTNKPADEVTKHLSWCLSQDGMVGIKYHLRAEKTCLSTSLESRDQFSKVLSSVERFNPFIIIHVNDFCESRLEEIKVLLELSQLYKGNNYIIAHSNTPKELSWLGKQYKDNPEFTRNIYTDTSSIEARIEDKDRFQILVNSWREFGMDRVIFGTDSADPNIVGKYGGNWSLIGLLFMEGLLTARERKMILQENSMRLLRKTTKKIFR